ncbi:MAG: NfeD family protein [Spirochaetales bacterium]|nr:NfeD family protein [Spirochaetales bacterium]
MFTNPSFLWGVAGVLLIASEMIIPGFTIFFFGMGALLTALAAAVLPPVTASLGLQAALWAGSSILSFIFLRRRFRKVFRGTLLDRPQEDGIGDRVKVLEEITPEKPGRVRYRGTSWTAVSPVESFVVGETVEIIETSGLILTVTKPFDGRDPKDDFMDRLETDT